MKHVVFNSGGIASYIVAKRVATVHGAESLIHLFTDTKDEDADLYRFLDETTARIGGERVDLADGRNLWELFRDNRFIANSQVDICSRVMKRDIATQYLKLRFPGGVGCVLYFGIDHSERERFYGREGGKPGIRARWVPFVAEAPLCEPPYMTKCEMIQECERDGIDPPRMYDEQFKHNNCSGFCVKGGHAHFLHLLKTRPETFARHAAEEQAFREAVGKDVSVMKDRRGGVTKPLPMLEFQRQVASGELVVNPRDWGKGCQCFTPDESETADV